MDQRVSIRTVVAETINRILADNGRATQNFGDDDDLVRVAGLDSLDLAVTVVSLEQRLGVDPFRTGRRPVRTFGDLVQAYCELLK